MPGCRKDKNDRKPSLESEVHGELNRAAAKRVIMLNLLFISSHPKIDIIRKAIQPSLKIKIDVVDNFDIGLKEVFDKRAALVFIQDRIAGVTGESVARHIQMLLGSDAPSFILMHDGNPKTKPIKGVCDHLIDLSQDNTKLLADIQATLKLLLGEQWQQLHIPPQTNVPDILPTLDFPEGQCLNADSLEEYSRSDLEEITPFFDDFELPETIESEASPEASWKLTPFSLDRLEKRAEAAASTDHNITATATGPGIKHVPGTPEATAPVDDQLPTAPPQKMPALSVPDAGAMPGKSPSTPISPVDFWSEKDRRAEEIAGEEALLDSEEDDLAKTGARKYQAIAVVVILGLIGGSWFLFKPSPHLKQTVVKESVKANLPLPVTAAPVVQQAISTTQRPATDALPSFIPLAGHDRAFSLQKPGWERYVGTDSEFRIFLSNRKLKAVQVLATDGHVISESRLKSILIELTGTGEYSISSHEEQFGFQVSRATVNPKADLLIYRKESAVHAFVVSLD